VRITPTAGKLQLDLGKREQHLLFQLLELYPRVPPAHQPLSKTARGPDTEANQRLLDEALAEHRAASQRRLKELLEDSARCKTSEHGCRLSLSAAEVEWLLQVLNDIRVGSWVRLGSPEQLHERALLNEDNAPDFWAMEIAGLFQQQILEGLHEKRET
jgi:hypothetical protein